MHRANSDLSLNQSGVAACPPPLPANSNREDLLSLLRTANKEEPENDTADGDIAMRTRITEMKALHEEILGCLAKEKESNASAVVLTGLMEDISVRLSNYQRMAAAMVNLYLFTLYICIYE